MGRLGARRQADDVEGTSERVRKTGTQPALCIAGIEVTKTGLARHGPIARCNGLTPGQYLALTVTLPVRPFSSTNSLSGLNWVQG